eukprot:CAMPEP_0184541374 /NCGR_PEP_ID=MMETSP0199_2-20130426/1332_1 /TAXON_ID=1112570 /ORGANISM="Thraustochytrium sp., Strain LLF1b" /LENGTH=549 /DNA_ID=CAMNT_0026935091 /DNA_START=126 /DNA_END=1775 /DNA_ORIENTATION=-
MGNQNVKFKSSLEALTEFDVSAARLLLDKYLALDMDFGIEADDLQRLFRECDMGLDSSVVKEIMASFPNAAQTKTLNALDFIEGFALLSRGSFDEIVELMFDIFDFQKRSEISFDELTIMLMCAAQGLEHLSTESTKATPIDDEKIAVMVRAGFGFAPGEERDIPKDHYMAWAREKAPKRAENVEEILSFLRGTSPVEDADDTGVNGETDPLMNQEGLPEEVEAKVGCDGDTEGKSPEPTAPEPVKEDAAPASPDAPAEASTKASTESSTESARKDDTDTPTQVTVEASVAPEEKSTTETETTSNAATQKEEEEGKTADSLGDSEPSVEAKDSGEGSSREKPEQVQEEVAEPKDKQTEDDTSAEVSKEAPVEDTAALTESMGAPVEQPEAESGESSATQAEAKEKTSDDVPLGDSAQENKAAQQETASAGAIVEQEQTTEDVVKPLESDDKEDAPVAEATKAEVSNTSGSDDKEDTAVAETTKAEVPAEAIRTDSQVQSEDDAKQPQNDTIEPLAKQEGEVHDQYQTADEGEGEDGGAVTKDAISSKNE